MEQAHRAGLEYFATHVSEVDPGWANLFGYMHRRFGLEATTAGGVPLHVVPQQQARQDIADVYRRLVDPTAVIPAQRIANLESTIDRITANALHCDRIPLPPHWVQILEHASEAGGYALTHSALASQWTLEQGCRSWEELAALQRHQVDRLVALVDDRAVLADRFEASADIWFEAIAMLDYLGAGTRIDPRWLEDLVDQQRPDGGWPRHPRARSSDPHATALALWVLSERLQPGAPLITWIAGARR